MTRLSHLKAIVNHIEANAPGVSTRSRGGNRYEGEEQFTITYNHLELYCIRRMAMVDTSNLDYCNGTGYSMDVVYDEVAVLNAYDTITEQENEALVDELNEILC
jgi:hypothetical protein